MPLNKLDNIIKNTEGRILYVSPSDLDATDSISNQGNSLARPFKTIQRALIESARFSYVKGDSNDETEKTTILLMPGEHVVDNRPGWSIALNEGAVEVKSSDKFAVSNTGALNLDLDSNFDLTQRDNDLYKFNSVNGGVIVPRGTSIVGLDLRKTKIRPTYVPNPTYTLESIPKSSIFRITGACYFWQFSIFDADEFGTVYTQPSDFSLKATPTFSHHKLSVFEYVDGVNNAIVQGNDKGLTDLQMYYAKLSYAYGTGSGRTIDSDDIFDANDVVGFSPRRPEFEIVGAFAADPISITSIKLGDGGANPTRLVTVTTQTDHNLNVGTPIRISGVFGNKPDANFVYNISTKVVSSIDNRQFTYTIEASDKEIALANATVNEGIVTVETDTVTGASPYIFNISMRSVWGMNGMHADGSKATGFRSMVVAQFTGVSLQKDDRAFVKYIPSSREYSGESISPVTGATLSSQSSSSGTVYHLDSDAIYRKDWEQTHIKISNDAIVQIVSVFAIGYNKHFEADTGGDASVTNSNSNFGQLSLISRGFKKEAFDKDNKGFITHIIPPRTIVSEEENIDWLTIDIDKTKEVGNNQRLYLNGFDNESVKPPILTQGYRVGAKIGDRIYLDIGGTEYSASILMNNSGNYSSYREVPISQVDNNEFVSAEHGFTTGEKVIIISDDGDLPENLKTNTVYYVIDSGGNPGNRFELAASKAESDNRQAITVYGGTNLKVISRVSDKQSGDVAHPVQWDGSQWYIKVGDNGIYTAISGLSGVSEPTYLKRIPDTRSLNEKLYKARFFIPKQLTNAKTPEAGFILQESSSTGYRANGDANKTSITIADDYDFERNPRFISTCSHGAGKATVRTELPHNLQLGDTVIIKNVTDSSTGGNAYNGTYTVSDVDNDLEFKYELESIAGAFTNDTTSRTINSPRFERNDLQTNLYIYRNEVISEYMEDDQDGIYHLYLLNADNAISEEFTNLKYSQNVTDLYPQLDRDNINDDPKSAKTFALRSPIGEVETNDLKKSITRETTDKLLTTLGIGLQVSGVDDPTSTTPIITFDRNHGLNGIVSGNVTAGSGYNTGTYQNVRLLNVSQTGTWKGATASVVVSNGSVGITTIINPGSGYNVGDNLFFDQSVIGAGDEAARFTVSGVSSATDHVIQFTGVGTVSDTYHRIITAVGGGSTVAISRTTGDPEIGTNHYGFIIGKSVAFTASGNTITANQHGLSVGNKFRSIDDNGNNLGDYIVGIATLPNEFEVTGGIGGASGFILKHGLSSNSGVSDRTEENLQSRAFTIFDGETMTLSESGSIGITTTIFEVSNAGIGTEERFPLGSYIQVNNEIMRIASDSLSGTDNNQITVLRGVLGTQVQTHAEGSLIKKIKVPSIELRRPSIIRASGHTFEYLGYGPGNYSTGLPQVQNKTLTEKEEFLVQSQERGGGIVVYTGMNNKGDFFIGNQKKTSATGEEVTFDTPIPTVTGENPSRLSAVFDEVTVKERLVVEGGDSKQILSQFDGPVTINNETRFTNNESISGNPAIKVSYDKDSTGTTSGALVVEGGVGIAKNVNIGGSMFFPDDKKLYFGDDKNLEIYYDSGNGVYDAGRNKNSFISHNDTDQHLYLNTQGDAVRIISGYTWTNGKMAAFNKEGSVDLYYNNDLKFATTGTGVTINGGVYATGVSTFTDKVHLLDDDVLHFGGAAGDDGDLQIYHSGVDSWISDQGTGNLYLDSTGGENSAVRIVSEGSWDNGKMAGFNTGGSVDLYYNNAKKFETTGSGVKITGVATATTFSGSLKNTLTLGTGTYLTGSTTYNNSSATTFTVGVAATYTNGGGKIVARDSNGDFSAGTITASLSGNATSADTATSADSATNATNADNIKTVTRATNDTHYLTFVDSNNSTSTAESLYTDAGIYYNPSTNNLSVEGDITAFASSDERLKDNITPIDNPLAKVISISGNTFDWNENSDKEGSDTGIIAQEIEALGLPGLVTTRDNGYKAVRYEKLVPLLIEAIKELSGKVDALEEKLSDK